MRLFTAICMIYECDLKLFTNTYRLKILRVYHVRHKIQSEQWVSASKEFKSSFLICCLNWDNAEMPLIFLGIRLHNFWPIYLMECLSYVVVLNLGIANSLFLSEYLVSVLWNRSAIYFGQMLFFVLYIRTAMSCNRLNYKPSQTWLW